MRDGEKFRLGDLCSIIKGETPIKQAIPGRYPLVVTAAERASHESFQFDCRAVIVPLVSSTGHGHASIKRINYQEGKFALGSILCAVVPKDEKRLSAKFLHVYFSYFKDQLIVPLMKGSANVSLSVGALAELKIIVPPMEVQQRVIRLAENNALMKPLEHEIAHQETLLTKLKKTILQEAISGKLTADWRAAHPDVEPASQLLHRIQAEKVRIIAAKKLRPEKSRSKITATEIPFEIPLGWEWCRLGMVTRFFDYRGKTPNKIKSGVRLITAKNVKFGFFSDTPRDYLSEDDYTRHMVRGFPDNGDILFTTEAPMGNACQLDMSERFALGQRLITIQPLLSDKRFFLFAMLSQAFQMQLLAKASGIAAKGIKSSRLVDVCIPLPPLAEQTEIVARVEGLMKHCQALAAEIAQTRTHAAHLLQAVLKEAFAPAS